MEFQTVTLDVDMGEEEIVETYVPTYSYASAKSESKEKLLEDFYNNVLEYTFSESDEYPLGTCVMDVLEVTSRAILTIEEDND